MYTKQGNIPNNKTSCTKHEESKYSAVRTCLNASDSLQAVNIHRMLQMSHVLITDQKPIIDTQEIKRKESKHNMKVIKSQGGEQERRNEQRTVKITRKQLRKWEQVHTCQ